jgi:predicted RNase H-like HicB family nuclease
MEVQEVGSANDGEMDLTMARPAKVLGRFHALFVDEVRRISVSEALRIPIRIVFYKGDGDWVAHCLEFDLVGTGATREDALEQLSTAIAMQVEFSLAHDNPGNLFSPADGKYLRMWAAGKDFKCQGELALQFDNVSLESPDCREYNGSELACV